MKLAKIVLLTASVAFVTPVLAGQWHGGRGDHNFGPAKAALDTNKDGKISAEEHAAHQAAVFKAADANKDGKLTAAELATYQEQERARMKKEREAAHFAKLDTNGDGVVSAEEFKAAGDQRFEKMEKFKKERGERHHRGDWKGERKGKPSVEKPADASAKPQ